MDHNELKRNIVSFSLDDGPLGSQGYNRVLLQLFGYTGHGKSSFINSCIYVLKNNTNLETYAEARESYSAVTLKRNAYDLTTTIGDSSSPTAISGHSNITIVDNRGCSAMTNFERAEIYAQLGNFYPLNEPVEWKDNFKEAMSALEESGLEPNVSDFLVPIFIYSSNYPLKRKDEKEEADLRSFFDNCTKMTGVFPITVLTNKTGKNVIELEEKFKNLGAETVIAIENYTMDFSVKTLGKTTDILMVIDTALRNVRFRLEQPRNAKRERVERKKILLNYIHKASTEHEKEKKVKETAMLITNRNNRVGGGMSGGGSNGGGSNGGGSNGGGSNGGGSNGSGSNGSGPNGDGSNGGGGWSCNLI